MKYLPNWLVCTVPVLSVLLGTNTHGAENSEFIYSNETMTLIVNKLNNEANNPVYSIQVSNALGGVAQWEIKAGFDQILDARLYSGKLAILGIYRSSQRISIWDIETRKEIDYIRCYHPSFSSTARYISFVLFYPRNALVHQQPMLYDLSLSPKANRLEIAEYTNAPIQADEFGYKEPNDQVGRPIALPGDGSGTDSYAFTPVDKISDVVFISKPSWTSDDNMVAFLTSTGRGSSDVKPSHRIMISEVKSLLEVGNEWLIIDLKTVLQKASLDSLADSDGWSVSISSNGLLRVFESNPKALIELQWK